ncbi:biotin--protein ligase isoform X1 [Maniola hyperantus]|uniref:biotin--protein ligase isoform X1 n=1 Tax=Aphantopus hyperantus TaxID=2795564 RepID=UPI003749CF4F
MLFTPIYIAMTFIKTWRIRSFRARLLEFLSGNTSVAFCKVPENAAETPTLSSKLCINPKNAYLCDLLDYTNASRICSMKPTQCIEVTDWVSCAGGLPLGSGDSTVESDLNVEVLFECEMDPHEESSYHDIVMLESMGQPVAWKAGSHLAIVLKTNIENLSVVGFHFVGGEFIIDHKLPVVRIQTVQISGEPNKATDLSMRGLRSEIQASLKQSHEQFQWPVHAALLRKLSKVVDIKSDRRNGVELNGGSDQIDTTSVGRRNVTLTDVSTITTKSLSDDQDEPPNQNEPESSKPVAQIEVKFPKQSPVKISQTITESIIHKSPEKKLGKSPEKLLGKSPERKLLVPEGGELIVENVTVEIQHNITPKKSSLKLDLKKGTSQLSSSLLNISSQIKSITTHKRVVSTTAPKRPQSQMEVTTQIKEETPKSSPSQMTPKSTKSSRPLVNTKSPNVLIYSDSIVARDNLEASLKKVLDCDRYTVYSVTPETLCAGAWRGRAALVAVAGCAGRAAPLLLAHLLDGGRLLGLCTDLLHTVLPHYKTAEIRENEVVQFSYDKWKSVKMKHHIFCYQASPAKKQFSTESDRQASQDANMCWYAFTPYFEPSKYTGHPGHELGIQVLASEETWRTPSLLQATDLTNNGVAIFSQIHLEADPCDYLGEEGIRSNEARLEILHKILGDILGLHVKDTREITQLEYTRGYFLGNHVQKMSLVEEWCKAVDGRRVQKLAGLTIQWCMRDEAAVQPPSETFLPVHLYECPEHFSTVEYFDNLTSTHLGRAVIYADVLSTTLAVTRSPLAHGVGAVARRQVAARGRGGNHWITTPGQAAMSLQVWRKISPTLPLVQHAVALAAVRAVRSDPAYDQLDIRIKWPNDIYFGREIKIGGTITTANCTGDDVIIDIGTGVNISNSVPTTCVNDIIADYNKKHGTTLASISIEKFLARYCSQLERILEYMETEGGVDAFLEQYYQYWLHSDEEIRVQSSDGGSPVQGTISGLDSAGWLMVRTRGGDIRVAPDGNTFDIMSGLIAPKL